MRTTTETTKRLIDLLKGFSTAMLITHGDKDLHARPMAVADVTEDVEIWFVSGDDTAKIHEIVEDTRAHVVCQKDHSAYLSLSGTASVIKDRLRVGELWKEAFRVWFPDGKDDPNLVLIRFRPSKAEFWDNTGFNRIAYMWESAKAYVTGKPPTARAESHAVLNLG